MRKILLLSAGVAGLLAASGGAVAGDIRPLAETCNNCHGVDGVSAGHSMPSIAGLPVKYLTEVMLEWKKDERFSTTMARLIKGYSDEQIADLAKFYADTATYNAPIAELISDEYAAKRRALIDMKRANPDIKPGEIKLRQGDTTYLTTADSSGMMVSLIQSNYRGMGSGLVPDGLGFMLQDRGELFALDPAHPNVYAPSKRPFQTIIPAFVMKAGKPFMSFGVMGGDLQPQGHVQILVNMIDFGLNVQEAGDAARFRHVSSDDWARKSSAGVGKLQLETGIGPDIRRELERRGHDLQPGDGGFGGYQAIMRDPATGAYWGASEMRKDGAAIGY